MVDHAKRSNYFKMHEDDFDASTAPGPGRERNKKSFAVAAFVPAIRLAFDRVTRSSFSGWHEIVADGADFGLGQLIGAVDDTEPVL